MKDSKFQFKNSERIQVLFQDILLTSLIDLKQVR